MKPQICVPCDKEDKQERCCANLTLTILIAIFTFALGILIEVVTEISVFIGLPVLIGLLVVLSILIVIEIIMLLCDREC